ncbi:hypothetical protein NL676_025507 [Syzygium grande]|nr:hypothetical protein NL676_025507 [Syzygium grande]
MLRLPRADERGPSPRPDALAASASASTLAPDAHAEDASNEARRRRRRRLRRARSTVAHEPSPPTREVGCLRRARSVSSRQRQPLAFDERGAAGSQALTAVVYAAKPNLVLLPNGRGWGSGGGLFSVDFVSLCCKYKRARRWLGVFRSGGLLCLLSANKLAPPSHAPSRAGRPFVVPCGEPPCQSRDKLQLLTRSGQSS